mmetsp:Transcript_41365/g.103241  ORF Transcript_41365/g.103241 Transcript_41365/m.103241 type:complete len:210 (-) Transcript_41365:942-1571(-)
MHTMDTQYDRYALCGVSIDRALSLCLLPRYPPALRLLGPVVLALNASAFCTSSLCPSHSTMALFTSSGRSSMGQCPVPSSTCSSTRGLYRGNDVPGCRPRSSGVHGSSLPQRARMGTSRSLRTSSGVGPAGPRRMRRKTLTAFSSRDGPRRVSMSSGVTASLTAYTWLSVCLRFVGSRTRSNSRGPSQSLNSMFCTKNHSGRPHSGKSS